MNRKSLAVVSRNGPGRCPSWVIVLLLGLPAWALAAAGQLQVSGVSGDMADNVQRVLRLADQDCAAPRWRVRRLFEAVDGEVVQALRPFGRYTPRVRKQLSFDKGCWLARIDIDPGEAVRWREVDLVIAGDAASDPVFAAILASAKPQLGAPALHADYEALKAKVLLAAGQRGYREGRFTRHELRVDVAQRSATASLHYDSGPRYRFGELHISQQAFAVDFIARYIRIRPGDPYDSVAITQLRRDLLDSGLFSRIDVTPRLGTSADQRVPLDVSLAPRKRHAYTVGVGASTDEGPRLRLGYENRRLNRRGHTGSAALRLSEPRNSLDLAYNIPLADPRKERVTLLAGYLNEAFADSDSETYKLGARYSRERWDDLVETWFVEASDDRFRIGDDHGHTRLVVPGVAWDWRRGDDAVYPRHGWRLSLELRGGTRSLLSDVDFARGYLRAKRVMPLGGNRLIARAEGGYSLVGGFDELPASQRFFAGGDNSVRGYAYRSLGPRDDSGRVIGGQRLLVGSLEVEHPLDGAWSLAAFVDSGDAFNGSRLQLHHGIGVGVRWRSPVGPVRIDLAHPLDPGADVVRLHFSLGPDL